MTLVPPVGAGSLGAGSLGRLGLDPSKPLTGSAKVEQPDIAHAFGQKINDAFTHLNDMQNTADKLAQAAATGDLQSVQDYLMASNEAQLATQLTVAVRNRAVEAFNEIMRMQV
jgi:flagellar hook-basal body complex protein FliE